MRGSERRLTPGPSPFRRGENGDPSASSGQAAVALLPRLCVCSVRGASCPDFSGCRRNLAIHPMGEGARVYGQRRNRFCRRRGRGCRRRAKAAMATARKPLSQAGSGRLCIIRVLPSGRYCLAAKGHALRSHVHALPPHGAFLGRVLGDSFVYLGLQLPAEA